MLMVIFGAGASYDSDVERPVAATSLGIARPPLAAQLVNPEYRPIANQYSQSIPVLDYIREHVTKESPDDLETILARFSERADNSAPCRKQLVAFRFYLGRVIASAATQWLAQTHGMTTYLTLVNQLLEWQEQSGERVQLVTFNYDTLLEDAVTRVMPEWTFTGLGDYINRTDPDWGLLKLHGSTSWSRVASDTLSSQGEENTVRALSAANGVHAGALPYVFRNALDIRKDQANVYIPALAVPMGDRKTFECDDLHLRAFESTIPDIDRMLVCGWRGAEKHAIEILSRVNPGFSLGIVAGSNAGLAEVQDNLGAVYRKGKLVMAEPDGMATFATHMRAQLAPLLAPR